MYNRNKYTIIAFFCYDFQTKTIGFNTKTIGFSDNDSSKQHSGPPLSCNIMKTTAKKMVLPLSKTKI